MCLCVCVCVCVCHTLWKGAQQHRMCVSVCVCVCVSYLVGGGGSSTACEGVDPGVTTAAVPMETGKGLPECTAPPVGSCDWTTGIGAIWMI